MKICGHIALFKGRQPNNNNNNKKKKTLNCSPFDRILNTQQLQRESANSTLLFYIIVTANYSILFCEENLISSDIRFSLLLVLTSKLSLLPVNSLNPFISFHIWVFKCVIVALGS